MNGQFGGRSSTRAHKWRMRNAWLVVAVVAITLGLTACPLNPEPVNFDADERIIRGSYEGFVDTRLPPRFLRLNADGSIAASVWWNTIELWDRVSDETTVISIPDIDDSWLFGLSINAAGNSLAVNNAGYVQLIDASDGSLVHTLDLRGQLGGCQSCGAQHVMLSPDGAILVAAGVSPRILFFDSATGALASELESAGNEVLFLGFSTNGGLLAAASTTDTRYFMQVWDLESNEVVLAHEFSHTNEGWPSFAYSADGQWFAVGAYDQVELFDLTGAKRTVPLLPSANRHLQALDPDATHMAFSTYESRTTAYTVADAVTGEVLAEFDSDLTVSYSAWSTDGRHIVIGHRLVNASTFEVEVDLAIGHYYEVSLHLDSHYIAGHSYRVTGTISIDGQPDLPVTGIVYGNDTHKYLRPQMRPPQPPRLTFEVGGHPWSVSADLWAHSLRVGDPGYEHRWIGSLMEDPYLENRYYKPFEMWRIGSD